MVSYTSKIAARYGLVKKTSLSSSKHVMENKVSEKPEVAYNSLWGVYIILPLLA